MFYLRFTAVLSFL